MLSQAIGTMQARGYNYKFAGAWAKQFSTGSKWTFGTGYCYWRYGPDAHAGLMRLLVLGLALDNSVWRPMMLVYYLDHEGRSVMTERSTDN